MMREECPYVSRGGLKLAAALERFDVAVRDLVCADLGCNVGGFTDCLLQNGAAHVFAVDTGYGAFAWKLRNDPRVTVLERTNALHAEPAQLCDLVVIDLGWTKQQHALPAAKRWLKPGGAARIITLIKPHYEEGKRAVLDDDTAHVVCQRVLAEIPALGFKVLSSMDSPIRGGASKGHQGNREYLALLEPLSK